MEYQIFLKRIFSIAELNNTTVEHNFVLGEVETSYFFPNIKLAIDYLEDVHQHTDAYFELAKKKEILAQLGIYYVLVESFDVENRLQEIEQIVKQTIRK
jgi:hypothetical protein